MKKLIVMLWSVVIALSGIAGYATMTYAGINDRYSYSFYNGSKQGNTGIDEKATKRRVYVHPTSGPALKYTVQGHNEGSGWNNRSTPKIVYCGSEAKIYNQVYQNNETYVRVHFVRTLTAYTYTRGYWNPDYIKED